MRWAVVVQRHNQVPQVTTYTDECAARYAYEQSRGLPSVFLMRIVRNAELPPEANEDDHRRHAELAERGKWQYMRRHSLLPRNEQCDTCGQRATLHWSLPETFAEKPFVFRRCAEHEHQLDTLRALAKSC